MALVALCVAAALLAACAPAHGSMLVGSEAPEFRAIAVIDKDFKEIALSQYRGNKYVVIFFYPLDFTFGASTPAGPASVPELLLGRLCSYPIRCRSMQMAMQLFRATSTPSSSRPTKMQQGIHPAIPPTHGESAVIHLHPWLNLLLILESVPQTLPQPSPYPACPGPCPLAGPSRLQLPFHLLLSYLQNHPQCAPRSSPPSPIATRSLPPWALRSWACPWTPSTPTWPGSTHRASRYQPGCRDRQAGSCLQDVHRGALGAGTPRACKLGCN